MVPFYPACYDHAAALINKSPWEVSRNADLLLAAHEAVLVTYGTESCVVGIDIYNLEPEAYGCVVEQPAGNESPTISKGICSAVAEVKRLQLNPDKDGRVPMILDTASALKERNPGVDVRIPLSGPFTVAAHLLGLEELVCLMMMAPTETREALNHLAEQEICYAQSAVDRGLALTFFESGVTPPLLSPTMFESEVAPLVTKIFESVTPPTAYRPHLVIGGDTLPILNAMLACDPGFIICPYETDQQAFLEHLSKRYKPSVRINMNPSALGNSNRQVFKKELMRVERLASISPAVTAKGGILPYDANPEVVQEFTGRKKDG